MVAWLASVERGRGSEVFTGATAGDIDVARRLPRQPSDDREPSSFGRLCITRHRGFQVARCDCLGLAPNGRSRSSLCSIDPTRSSSSLRRYSSAFTTCC